MAAYCRVYGFGLTAQDKLRFLIRRIEHKTAFALMRQDEKTFCRLYTSLTLCSGGLVLSIIHYALALHVTDKLAVRV